MKIAVIHGEVAAGAGRDEQDVLTQVDFVSRGLAALGHEPVAVPVSLNLAEAAQTLTALQPAMVFNLVETLAGKGSLIHIVPALLDALKIPYTGAGTEAMHADVEQAPRQEMARRRRPPDTALVHDRGNA